MSVTYGVALMTAVVRQGKSDVLRCNEDPVPSPLVV